MAFVVRPATPYDAPAWVECYLLSMEHAYGALMPPEFASAHLARADELVEQRRRTFAQEVAGRPSGWLAEDESGVVAVAEAGLGPGDWERERDLPEPPTSLELHKLYALPQGLGTGAGQALLDAAVGDDPAYLWLVAGNDRAAAFYSRNGFRPDGVTTTGGPAWFGRTMIRMARSSGPSWGDVSA